MSDVSQCDPALFSAGVRLYAAMMDLTLEEASRTCAASPGAGRNAARLGAAFHAICKQVVEFEVARSVKEALDRAGHFRV
jgi:hypothetical protein